MIFTFCYAHPYDAGFVQDIRSIVEASGGQVFPVHLYCDRSVLQDRVVSPDREAFQKLRSVQGLEEALERWDFSPPCPVQIPGASTTRHWIPPRLPCKSSLISGLRLKRVADV